MKSIKNMMKNLLLGALLLLSTFNAFAQNSIEGKWKPQGFQNTLYIFENGERFTYYCTSGNCDSLYNTFEAGDGNNIPNPLEYSVTNDTITIDFNFGNIVVSHMAFSCEGNIVTFVNQNNLTLIRLGTNIEDCTSSGVLEEKTISAQIFPNPTNGAFTLSFKESFNGKLIISDGLGKVIYTDQINGIEKSIDLSNFSSGIYSVFMQSEKGIISKKIILD